MTGLVRFVVPMTFQVVSGKFAKCLIVAIKLYSSRMS